MGDVSLNRCYYHCRTCGRGHVFWDRTLGLSQHRLTPAASQIVALAGAKTSFAEASQTELRKLAGLRLSESTVERVTEDAGQRLAQLLEDKQTLGNDEVWPWQRDAQGRTCAYVSLDATGVRQQGPKGSLAEGRMAYVGMIYNPSSPHDPRKLPWRQTRYLAGFYGLPQLGLQLRRQAAQVGWDEAQQQIALTDGGSGLEEFLQVNFPRAVRILDFWHAKEHLTEFSLAWCPDDEPRRKRWLDEQCHRLKHEGGAAVLEQLESLNVGNRSAAVQEAHRVHTQYFRNHVSRMDYPRYLAQGWQIGSGPVESACKTVVGARLKGSGMRWGEEGSDAVCHLRALHLSQPGQWEAFWRDHPN